MSSLVETGQLLQPEFPPLLKGRALGAQDDPFHVAIQTAQDEMARDNEATPGLVHYAQSEDMLRAAITFTPEEPLSKAMGAVWATQLGFIDALGALAPPEIAVQIAWPQTLHVNGARCGHFRAAASTQDPAAEPEWLIVGLEIPLIASGDDVDGGETPDDTTLGAEGCGELTPPMLLESWTRHTLVWIHSYLNEGLAPLHDHYRGKCLCIGTDITSPEPGHFTGLDEIGGMILQQGDTARIIPLTVMLERP